jgi:hypothetical protein
MEYVELRAFGNQSEAGAVLAMLRRARIDCFLKDEHIRADTELRPAIGGLKLMVHHSHAETAWELLDRAEEAYLRNIPCPVCHAHALKAISIMRHHSCRLSALASMLLTGHSVEINKIYQCSRCGYDFKELPGRGF